MYLDKNQVELREINYLSKKFTNKLMETNNIAKSLNQKSVG